MNYSTAQSYQNLSAFCSHCACGQLWVSPELTSSRSLSVFQGLSQSLPRHWKVPEAPYLVSGLHRPSATLGYGASSALGLQLWSCIVQSPGEEALDDFTWSLGAPALYCWIPYRCIWVCFMTVLGSRWVLAAELQENCTANKGERQKDLCLFLQVNFVWEAVQA